MAEWIHTELGCLFDVKAGGDLQEEYYSPCMTVCAKWPVYANSLGNRGLYGYTSKPRYKGNAVTITGRGEIGHAEYRKEDFDAIVRLLVLQPIAEVDCRYITYYINSNIHFPIESTGVPQLTVPKVKRVKVYLPKEMSEQTAIANILSKVDEAIAAIQNSIDFAERLKKSLMQNLLTGKMKPDGTFRTPEEFYVDEKFGEVPIGWEIKKLGRIFDIKAGGDLQEKFFSPIKDEKHPYPIYSNSFENKGLYGYTSNPRFVAKESITITGRGEVGHPEYRQGDYDAIIRLMSLIPKKEQKVDCRFVCYYIDNFVHFAIESTGVPQLTCPKVYSTKIVIPTDVEVQSLIGRNIFKLDTIIEAKRSRIATLERLKKSLMQNLLTGKVRINNN